MKYHGFTLWKSSQKNQRKIMCGTQTMSHAKLIGGRRQWAKVIFRKKMKYIVQWWQYEKLNEIYGGIVPIKNFALDYFAWKLLRTMSSTSKAAYEFFTRNVESKKTKFKKHSFYIIVTTVTVSALALLGIGAYIFFRNGDSDLVGITFAIGIVILVVTSICCYQWR